MRHKDWYDNGVRYVVLFYRAEQFAGSLQSSAAVAGAADSSARCAAFGSGGNGFPCFNSASYSVGGAESIAERIISVFRHYCLSFLLGALGIRFSTVSPRSTYPSE